MTRAASKGTATRAQPRKRQPKNESWASQFGMLVTSQLSREILADVLNAAADVLRQHRTTGQQAYEFRAIVGRGPDLASTAVQVGTEAATGAVDAGAEITAAAVDIAQTAAGTLATVATSAVLNILPGVGTGDEEGHEGEDHEGGTRRRVPQGPAGGRGGKLE